MSIGVRLREERERLAMSQEKFAALGGVQKRAQINYESGERLPDAGYLAAIAADGADVMYILTGEHSSAQPARDAAEQVLLNSYRSCSAQARQHLIQTAALLSFESMGTALDPDMVVYFAGIDGARFKRVVEPGDQLILEASLLRHKGGIYKYAVKGSVDGATACEAELMCTMRKIA